MSTVQPDLIAWWYKGLYYRDLQMAQCVERGFLTQEQHDDIKAVNGWWGGYRYVKQDPQRERPDSVPPLPELFSTQTQSQDSETPADDTQQTTTDTGADDAALATDDEPVTDRG
ncbi:hypothetical protein [Brevibacterium aurantiacum]|uniref:hypothetical protein n=1 Tax=Brevibacterium aurantiacum TaxID=273384 RepID=UPI003F93ED55